MRAEPNIRCADKVKYDYIAKPVGASLGIQANSDYAEHECCEIKIVSRRMLIGKMVSSHATRAISDLKQCGRLIVRTLKRDLKLSQGIMKLARGLFNLYEDAFVFINIAFLFAMTTLSFGLVSWVILTRRDIVYSVTVGFIWMFLCFLNLLGRWKVVTREKACYQILKVEKWARRLELASGVTTLVGMFAVQFLDRMGMRSYLEQTLLYGYPVNELLAIVIFYNICLIFSVPATIHIALSNYQKASMYFRILAGLSFTILSDSLWDWKTRNMLKDMLKSGLNEINKVLWSEPQRPQIDVNVIQDKFWFTMLCGLDRLKMHLVVLDIQSLTQFLKGQPSRHFINRLAYVFDLKEKDFLKMKHSSLATLTKFIKAHSAALGLIITLTALSISFLSWRFPVS